MTETVMTNVAGRTVTVPWRMYPNRYGTWVNPDGRLYHYNEGVDHDRSKHVEDGPWLRLNEADVDQIRNTYYKPFKAASAQRDQLEDGLRDLLGDDCD